MTKSLAGVDTNILIYAYDTSEGRKHKIARDFVIDVFTGKKTCAIALQSFKEFYHLVATRRSDVMEKHTARNLIAEFINIKHWKKLLPNEDTILRGVELNIEHNVHFWDTHIAAVMLQHGITKIYTENVKDFKKIPGIQAINPFKS